MMSLRSVFVLTLFLVYSVSGTLAKEEEEFSETLLLRPLPDRKVLSYFHFQTTAPPTHSYGHHHNLFPKSIHQLVQKFRIREMELSFTQGRWNYEHWGGYDPISSSNAKPPGVELWAVFDVPLDQVDASWENLTNALSGLFCASINSLEDSTVYSSPQWSFRSSGVSLRYGALPREAVCTENLIPWFRLLPCRDKAGLSALMDRSSIYGGHYHSQRLHLSSDEYDPDKKGSGVVLDQTLTIVLQTLQPSWSISSLFGRKISGKCAVSKSSNVYIQLEKNLLSELEKNGGSDSDLGFSESLEISIPPSRVIREVNDLSILYEFPVANYSDSKRFDLRFGWKFPLVWSCQQAPLRVSRYLTGSGNERGSIAISFVSNDVTHQILNSGRADQCWLRVDVFQVVPWHAKVYYHTLKVFIDEKLQNLSEIVEWIRVSPSEDKVSPGILEMTLRIPCAVKSAAVTLDYDKGFLHIRDYPPDANLGLDIPSALVIFRDFETSMNFVDDSLRGIPLLSKLQERTQVRSYTEVLLVLFTTPDFDMPVIVIQSTSLVFTFYIVLFYSTLIKRSHGSRKLAWDR